MSESTQATPEPKKPRQKPTTEQRQAEIARLQAKLQKQKALLSKDKRQERNGHLIAWGVMVEAAFSAAVPDEDPAQRETRRRRLVDLAHKHLRDRTLARALAGFDRLRAEDDASKIAKTTEA